MYATSDSLRCFQCGEIGHKRFVCPQKNDKEASGGGNAASQASENGNQNDDPVTVGRNTTGEVEGEGEIGSGGDGTGAEDRGSQGLVASVVSEASGSGQGEEQGDREVQQTVRTETGVGASEPEQWQVGEGNEWTEVEGRKRRKRRGAGEQRVPQTQGKRHAGTQRGVCGSTGQLYADGGVRRGV